MLNVTELDKWTQQECEKACKAKPVNSLAELRNEVHFPFPFSVVSTVVDYVSEWNMHQSRPVHQTFTINIPVCHYFLPAFDVPQCLYPWQGAPPCQWHKWGTCFATSPNKPTVLHVPLLDKLKLSLPDCPHDLKHLSSLELLDTYRFEVLHFSWYNWFGTRVSCVSLSM